MAWWQIDLNRENAEDFGQLLQRSGAAGFEAISNSNLRCFFEGDKKAFLEFLSRVEPFGFNVISSAELPDTNWSQSCPELTEPLELGEITIVPVTSGLPIQKTERDIFVVPGMGFGTGHHASTQLALGYLFASEVKELKPQKVLDLGTGSGILAIAAAKKYGCQVTATDIDPYALENATENISLNKLQNLIQLQNAELASLSGQFDLILANIYAEVLVALEPGFYSHLKPNGCLILSGIMSSLESAIDTTFIGSRWTRCSASSKDNWSGRLYLRN